jgi:hypothetical protein
MSGAVMGGAFGMLQGARAASKLKMVQPLSACFRVMLSLGCFTHSSAVFSKDAFEPSVQRCGPAFSRLGGKFRCHVHFVHYESAWYSVLEIGSGGQSEHNMRRVPCWRSVQVSDLAIILARHMFAHPYCRCTSGFKPMATFAVGGAVIGTIIELATDGSSLKKLALG